MKRAVSIMILLMVLSSLSAGPGGGYSFALVGEKEGEKSFGGAEISAYLTPEQFGTRGRLEAGILLSAEDSFFKGFNLMAGAPLSVTASHPFNYCFSNTVLYEPTLFAGVGYRRDGGWNLSLRFSPFLFQDTAFLYEILSPWVLISTDFTVKGWGLSIFRVSATFGGKE